MTITAAELLRSASAELHADLRQDIIGQTRWLTAYVTALGTVILGVAALLF